MHFLVFHLDLQQEALVCHSGWTPLWAVWLYTLTPCARSTKNMKLQRTVGDKMRRLRDARAEAHAEVFEH